MKLSALTMSWLAMAATLIMASAAQADAIDGRWCFSDGRSLSIDGSNLMTPGGRSIEGLYDRHAFEYKAPEDERDAGATVLMILVSDDVMNLIRTGVDAAKPEIWRRCQQQMS